MKITFWGDAALKSYGKLKKGARVCMTGLAPRKANSRWATHGDIELVPTKGLQIQLDDEHEEDEDDDLTILHNWNAPPSILKMQEKCVGTILDAIGFVYAISDVKTVTTKQGKSADVLTFELIDSTARIRVSAWGKQAHTEIREGQLLGIKGARISEYNGRSLIVTGYIEKNHQGTICDDLTNWKQSQNPVMKALCKQIKNLSDKATFCHEWNTAPTLTMLEMRQMKEKYRIRQKLPTVSVVKIRGRIDDVNNSLWYSKPDGLHWRVKLVIEDDQNNWLEVIGFDDVGKKFFELTAEEASKLQINEEEKFATLINSIKYKNSNQQHVFCIYAKENKWNTQIKYLDWIIGEIHATL